VRRKRFSWRFVLTGLARTALRQANNSVNIALGRNYIIVQEDRFFFRIWRNILYIAPKLEVTCYQQTYEDCPPDGVGSQTLLRMLAINYAQLSGLAYHHTPFREIGHEDRPMAHWVAGWEAHFNLGIGEAPVPDEARQISNFVEDTSLLLGLSGCTHEDLVGMFATTSGEFRQKYYVNKNRRHEDEMTVCVHVRRGDVTSERADMWTEMAKVANTLAVVRAVLKANRIVHRIRIISQGSHAEFATLDGPDTSFHLDADPYWSMQLAVEADVLIAAKSCFSYVAGVISEGVKLCEEHQFWSFPFPRDWLRIGPEGAFDQTEFERQLLRHAAAKSLPPL